MARTQLTSDDLYRLDRGDTREKVRVKLAEHDTALDDHDTRVAALEGGTTASVVTIHPADSLATSDVADLTAFPVDNDGLTLVANKRVFLPFQNDSKQNGLYVVGAVAGGTAPLTRASDFDGSAEIKPGTLVAVAGGTVGGAGGPTLWELTNTVAPVPGTDSITFAQVLNKTQLATYLALMTQAGLIGSDAAGYTAATVKLQLAEVKALADAHDVALSALTDGALQKRTVTVTHAELTSEVAGEAQAIDIGAVLPANARILGRELSGLTEFSGGDVASCTLDIGGTDADAIVAAQNVFAGAGVVDKQGTSGVNPNGNLGGQQLKATFTPDGAHALAALDAGAVTITVLFSVLE